MTQLQSPRPSYRLPGMPDAWTPVLVAVVTNAQDLRRAKEEHWYRIPLKRAPRQIAAEYLALYQTARFGAEGRHIRYYAPILRYHILPRHELIPQEPDHPRAQELYFKLELGEMQALERPIPNTRHPRLTFLITTLERLFHAQDVADLWLRGEARQKLYAAVRERGLAVECWYPENMQDREEADLALFGPGGEIQIFIDEPDGWAFEEPDVRWLGQGEVRVNALAVLRDAAGVCERLLRQ